MQKWLLLVLLAVCSVLKAQPVNLIPDSSFEDNKSCPTHFNQFGLSKHWYSVTGGTPDLFSTCFTSPINEDEYDKTDALELISAHAPQNDIGFQYPHSGNTYAGLVGFASINKEYAEYMAVPLLKPLEKGKTYHLRMYVSLADMSFYYGSKLGAVFVKSGTVDAFGRPVKAVKRPMLSNNTVSIKTKPDVEFDLHTFTDTVEWKLVEADFTVPGGEDYMVFGSFGVPGSNGRFPAKNKETGELAKRKPYAYYYIDDVSITESVPDDTTLTKPIIAKVIENKPLVIPNLYFETNKWDLLPTSFFGLDSVATYLKTLKGYRIEIAGHTDDVGADADNKTLSQNRAKAVAEYLISKGISRSLISYVGYGETQPVAVGTTPAIRAQNRRVTISLIKQ